MQNELIDIIVNIISVIMIIIIVILALPAFMICLDQLGYFIQGKIDKSTGTVHCDNKSWSGNLYRVSSHLETNNLQTPMFRYWIHHPTWYIIIEESGFCKDLRIEAK